MVFVLDIYYSRNTALSVGVLQQNEKKQLAMMKSLAASSTKWSEILTIQRHLVILKDFFYK